MLGTIASSMRSSWRRPGVVSLPIRRGASPARRLDRLGRMCGCDRPIRGDPHETRVDMASDRSAVPPPAGALPTRLPIHLRVRAVDQPDRGRVRQGDDRRVTVCRGVIPGVHRPRPTSRRKRIPLHGHCAILLTRLKDGSNVRPVPVDVFRWRARQHGGARQQAGTSPVFMGA
jgi:hypothetical protein